MHNRSKLILIPLFPLFFQLFAMEKELGNDFYLSQLEKQVQPALGHRLYVPGFNSSIKESKDKKKQEDQSQLDPFKSQPFKHLKYQNKAVGKVTKFSDNFSEGVSSHDQPMSLDSFISGLANVSANIIITRAVGPYASAAISACSEAKYLREKFDELNTEISNNAITDNWCTMNLGCTYQESIEALRVVLSAAEKLDQQKRKVIETHKAKLRQFADFVLEGYKSAQENYPELFKTKVKKDNSLRISNIPEFDLEKSHQEYWAQHQRDIQQFEKESKVRIATSKSKKPANSKSQKTSAKKDSNSKNAAATDTPQMLTPEMLEEHAKIFAEQIKKLDALSKYNEFKSEMEYQETMGNIAGGFNGIAAIAGIFGHKKEAYAIRTFGAAGIQAVDSMRTIMQKGLAGAGIHPYVGILMAVEGLCELMFQEEDDSQAKNTEAIINAITQGIMHLSQQMYQMREEMREQFEEVRKRDTKHHFIVLEKFFALHLDQKNILHNLQDLHNYIAHNHKAIQSGLEALHARVDSNFRMTLDNLNGLRVEDIDDDIQEALLLPDDASPEEFGKCIQNLFIKGTSRASADSLTGGSIDIHSPTALQTTLEGPIVQQNIFGHPAFPNVNLLSRYLEGNFNNFKHEKLVNPLIWIKCVDTIVPMLSQKLARDKEYPPTKNMKDSDIEKLLLLKKQGKKIRAFINRVYENNYLEKIAQKYYKALSQLSAAVQQEQENFEKKGKKLLRRELSATIEAEKSKTNGIVNSYECKKCVEYITNALKNAKTANAYTVQVQGAGYSCPTYLKGQSKRIDYKESKLITVEDVHQPSENFKRIYEEYLDERQAKNESLLKATKVDLEQSSFKPIGDGMSTLIYPAGQNSDLPKLMRPRQPLPINPLYIIAENKGLGIITHTYHLTDERFHLESFFCFKTDDPKIKILHLSLEHDFQKEMYTLNENINHFWEGGRFPKSIDTFTTNGVYPSSAFTVRFDGALGLISSGYFPPDCPYPAARDTFVSKARNESDQADQFLPFFQQLIQEDEPCIHLGPTTHKRSNQSQDFLPLVQQLIQEDQQEKRLQFNQEIMTQVSSKSPTSDIFKAAQQVDVSFKILDSLLTLMYHDFMNEGQRKKHPELATITGNDDKYCIKNNAALTRYLQNYSSKHDSEHKQGDYLPYHLKYNTFYKLRRALGTITKTHFQPQFKAVTQVIDNINMLVANYTKRKITPGTIAIAPKKIHEDSQLLAIVIQQIKEKDKKIDQLIQSNEELEQSNKKLATETKGLKQEVAGLNEQMQKMMALLIAMNNGKQTTDNLSNVYLAQKPSVVDRKSSPSRYIIKSYITHVKRVKQQVAAECGYHALFNALGCFTSDILFEQFMQENKQHIKDSRHSADDQWLSEDEVAALVQKNKTETMNITVIPDITRYKDGKSGLEHSVLVAFAQSQAALGNRPELYKHVFILRTGKTDETRTHWVAVEQTIKKDSTTEYAIMNSLPGHAYKEYVTMLQDILHNRDNQYAISVFDPMVEETLSYAISQLHLSTIFKARSYARTGESKASDYRIVDKNHEKIVDDILQAAQQLLDITEGLSFWSTCGHIEPNISVLDALSHIVDCDGEALTYKNSIDDKEEHKTVLHITNEQNRHIENLISSLENL